MITEERIQEALECFKKAGTDEERREAALAVFLRAVDDVPVDNEGETISERLTINEARLLASLVEGNVNRIILDAGTLNDFWEEISDPDHSHVESERKFHEVTMLPLDACVALYDKFQSIRNEGEAVAEKRWDNRWKGLVDEHSAVIVQMQKNWQIERDMVEAWKERTERLRRSLIRMAESPHYCESCEAGALAPVPF